MNRLSLAMIFGLLVPIGCTQPKADARQALDAEVAVRAQNRNRSNAAYRKGLDAKEADNPDQARENLRRAVHEDSTNLQAWMALGVVAFDLDDFSQAAEAFHNAIRLAPLRYEPRFNMGSILEAVGRYEQAIEQYEKALELSPGQHEVMENLVRCYIITGRKQEEAKRLAERALLVESRPEWRAWLEAQVRTLEPSSAFRD